jgi:hypothetical protein
MHELNGKRNISSVEKTWVRATTDSKMVPPESKKVQLDDNVAGLDIQANGTPVMHELNGKRNMSSAPKTWIRGTTNAAMVPEDNNI